MQQMKRVTQSIYVVKHPGRNLFCSHNFLFMLKMFEFKLFIFLMTFIDAIHVAITKNMLSFSAVISKKKNIIH